MVGGTMESHVLTLLDIWETLVPCTGILIIVHMQDVYNHSIDNLGSAIGLGVERSGFCELGVQKRPKTRPKGVEEPVVLVKDDGLWYPKVILNSFEEELGSIDHYEILLTGCEDGHPKKSINDHKHAVISVLGGQKTMLSPNIGSLPLNWGILD
jgi:hypothetical protein